jgi:hypothetical protein
MQASVNRNTCDYQSIPLEMTHWYLAAVSLATAGAKGASL